MTTKPTLPTDPQEAALSRRPQFSWRLFWLLALATLLTSLLLVPYALQLASAGSPELDPQSASAATTIAVIIQAVLLYWPMALVGLLVSSRLGFGAPILSGLVMGQPVRAAFSRILRPAAIIGLGAGVVLLLLSYLINPITQREMERLGIELPVESMANAFQGFLASISAGINEEVILRLFLLSLIAWGIQRLRRQASGRPGAGILWTANVISALIFGLLHLPNLTAMGIPLTPFLLAQILALNGLAGLAFGWLFWTYGLEAAILAHLFADIVLHVLSVPLQALFS